MPILDVKGSEFRDSHLFAEILNHAYLMEVVNNG
jgi:hypothetical protein